MIRNKSGVLVPVLAAVIVSAGSSAATAEDWSTPEAVTRNFYEMTERVHEDPDTPEFKAAVEEIFDPDAAIMFVIGDQSAGLLTVPALENVARQLLRNKFRRQYIDAGREITDIQCTTHGKLASCAITVEVTLRDGSGRTRSFEDIVGLVLDGDRWRITSARWLVVPRPDAKTLFTLALDPTSISNVRSEPPPFEREWNRKLPILGKKVYEMGIDLPLPIGVAVIPNWTRQELELESLRVQFGGSDVIDTDWVDFAGIFTETTSIQVKGDFFLFPFLNIFATVGHVEGDIVAPISFLARDAIDLVDPGICSGLFSPGFCDRRINYVVRTKLDNNNVGIGIVPAMGYENFFFTMPVNHTWTFLDDVIEGSPVTTWVVSPRIGLTAPTKQGGRISVYVGATYLKSENEIVSDFTIPIPDDVPIIGGREIDLVYEVTQSGVDPWNYVVGFNWDFLPGRALQIEAATGGARDQVIASFTQRF